MAPWFCRQAKTPRRARYCRHAATTSDSRSAIRMAVLSWAHVRIRSSFGTEAPRIHGKASFPVVRPNESAENEYRPAPGRHFAPRRSPRGDTMLRPTFALLLALLAAPALAAPPAGGYRGGYYAGYYGGYRGGYYGGY